MVGKLQTVVPWVAAVALLATQVTFIETEQPPYRLMDAALAGLPTPPENVSPAVGGDTSDDVGKWGVPQKRNITTRSGSVVARNAKRYKYMLKQTGTSKPVRWDPCEPHVYKVNMNGAPPEYLQEIKTAVTTTMNITGTEWSYGGETTVIPKMGNINKQHETTGADLVIAFAEPGKGKRKSNILLPGTVGVAGFNAESDPSGVSNDIWITTSYLLLSKKQTIGLPEAMRGAAYRHELGHTLGLGHVKIPSETMNPTLTENNTTVSKGWVEGLKKVSSKTGTSCAT
jgi:hypothetical protein